MDRSSNMSYHDPPNLINHHNRVTYMNYQPVNFYQSMLHGFFLNHQTYLENFEEKCRLSLDIFLVKDGVEMIPFQYYEVVENYYQICWGLLILNCCIFEMDFCSRIFEVLIFGETKWYDGFKFFCVRALSRQCTF